MAKACMCFRLHAQMTNLDVKLLMLTQVRTSRYSPKYLEPTVSKEELTQELDDSDERRYRPIKAALNEHSTSVNYDPLVQKFIRLITKEGDKERARMILDKTFQHIKFIQLEKYHRAKTDEQRESIEVNPHKIFHQAIENCKPLLITQDVKRGGVLYQVPIPVKPNYQLFKAMRWLEESADDKPKGIRVWDTLSKELIDAYNNQGKSVRKKQELHKLCEANRAYAHFRW